MNMNSFSLSYAFNFRTLIALMQFDQIQTSIQIF